MVIVNVSRGLPAGVTVYPLCAWCLQRPELGTGSPGTKVTDSSVLPSGCWKSNPSLLEEQAVLSVAPVTIISSAFPVNICDSVYPHTLFKVTPSRVSPRWSLLWCVFVLVSMWQRGHMLMCGGQTTTLRCQFSFQSLGLCDKHVKYNQTEKQKQPLLDSIHFSVEGWKGRKKECSIS